MILFLTEALPYFGTTKALKRSDVNMPCYVPGIPIYELHA